MPKKMHMQGNSPLALTKKASAPDTVPDGRQPQGSTQQPYYIRFIPFLNKFFCSGQLTASSCFSSNIILISDQRLLEHEKHDKNRER